MPQELITPTWFFGMDVVFQFAFMIITLVVSFYAFKIYKLTTQEQSRLLGYAFLFIGVGYFIQSFFNFAIISTLGEDICTLAQIESIHTFEMFGTYFYMIFSLIGVVTLTYMTLKTDDKKIYYMILLISLLSLFLSVNPGYIFYGLSSVLFGFIVHHYAQNYQKRKKTMTLLTLLAFVFLFFSRIHYIFSRDISAFYVLGNFLELFAYILILVTLILINKK